MLRRLAVSTLASRKLATAVTATPTRGYFYANVGEVGISASTMKCLLTLTLTSMVMMSVYIKVYVFDYLGTKKQFVEDTTDLWNDDGTVMEGEEAVANLRIQHERIMPFMDDIKGKMSA